LPVRLCLLLGLTLTYLDTLIDDSVDDTKRVEVEFDTLDASVGDLLVLLVKVVEELFRLVTTERLTVEGGVSG
jgi:hypothetical protein